MLSEGGIRQPVVIDEDKEVQDTIVEQAALRVARGNVPAGLAGRSILKVETGALFSAARTKGDATAAIDAIVNDAVASRGRIILYVDETTNFVGDTATRSRLMDSVATGKLVIIGASSAAALTNASAQNPRSPDTSPVFSCLKGMGRSPRTRSKRKPTKVIAAITFRPTFAR